MRPNRRPSCSHTFANRIYGGFKCTVCGEWPNMGWLYSCRHDDSHFSACSTPHLGFLQSRMDKLEHLDEYVELAECLEMSSSIIRAFRANEYTKEQMTRLINQRRQVIKVIMDDSNPSHMSMQPALRSTPKAPPGIYVDEASHAEVRPSTQDQSRTIIISWWPQDCHGVGANARVPSHNVLPAENLDCDLKVCHACRPSFRDRAYTSFESAFGSETPEQIIRDPSYHPVRDSKIASNFNLEGLFTKSTNLPLTQNDTHCDIQGFKARHTLPCDNVSEPCQATSNVVPLHENSSNDTSTSVPTTATTQPASRQTSATLSEVITYRGRCGGKWYPQTSPKDTEHDLSLDTEELDTLRDISSDTCSAQGVVLANEVI